jgi:hypothetical protein
VYNTGGNVGGSIGWNLYENGNSVILVSRTTSSKPNTFSYSSTGMSTGTITLIKLASNQNEQYILQNNWNGAIVDFNPSTEFNKYRIVYNQDTSIDFYIFDHVRNEYVVVHHIERSIITNPNFRIATSIINVGVTQASSTLQIKNMSGFTLGTPMSNIFPVYTQSVVKTLTANTTTNILSMRNRQEMNGLINMSYIVLETISIANECSKFIIINIILNPTTIGIGTTGNYPQWTYANQLESLVEIDTNATSYTGGKLVYSKSIGKDSYLSEDIYDLNLKLNSQDIFVISVTTQAGGAGDISLSLVRRELQ